MKQPPLLYAPEANNTGLLPPEEAHHALRVLRLGVGEEVTLIDGSGTFHHAKIVEGTNHTCRYTITGSKTWHKPWMGHIHLAIAPTKNADRMEWLVEKAVEIGIDELTLLLTEYCERKTFRTDRLEKIAVSAMKQSLKATLPRINPLTPFGDFLATTHADAAFICHCHGEYERTDLRTERCGGSRLVLIGPEGDFSAEEVNAALARGYRSASLGESRLRTETAGLVAVHLMHLSNLCPPPTPH